MSAQPHDAPRLGVCYYPEHVDASRWRDDARRMRDMGLKIVRIGEFAWSRIEPSPEDLQLEWLDEAIEALGGAGLRVVLGTPTACPPKWLVDRSPDILALDEHGRPRGFGSRRHYCFSSPTYRVEARRIVRVLGRRYGACAHIEAWQLDNEYGCHDTVLSYSHAALDGFRRWLRARYGSIEKLNEAWGAVFWSQEYRSFEEIEFPIATVTEANPSHRLDFRRFASDEVVAFNQLQVAALREAAPHAIVSHNFMGWFDQFDHHAVGRDLDIATWDSYPLGFLEQFEPDESTRLRYLRQGHPDTAAFHHDLYRGCARGRWWVMEQQPGPVNWARFNPAPLPGMVRAWIWEAFAHGAEVVSLFPWRQTRFAQEQMHAALHRVDDAEDVAAAEVRQTAREMKDVSWPLTQKAPVALVFSYEASWAISIQPQGADFSYLQLVFDWYSAARSLGLNVDVVAPSADLSSYRLVLAPSLPIVSESFVDALAKGAAQVLIGPRSGSRHADFSIPTQLPPGPLQRLISLRAVRVESLRPGAEEVIRIGREEFRCARWLEHIEGQSAPQLHTQRGVGVWHRNGRISYLNTWPEQALLRTVMERLCAEAGVRTMRLPDGLRIRSRGDLHVAVNYAPELVRLPDVAVGQFLLGACELEPAGVAVWRS